MKPIKNKIGYFVDEQGNIYSSRRAINSKDGTGFKSCVTDKLRKLKPCLQNNGYRMVSFGDRSRKSLHRIVAETFIKKIKGKNIVCHKDGNKENNSVNNLYWGDHKENSLDTKKHGTYLFGEKSYISKLKNIEIPIIKKLLLEGVTQKEIAKRFNVSRSCIRNIKLNKSWKNITSTI